MRPEMNRQGMVHSSTQWETLLSEEEMSYHTVKDEEETSALVYVVLNLWHSEKAKLSTGQDQWLSG